MHIVYAAFAGLVGLCITSTGVAFAQMGESATPLSMTEAVRIAIERDDPSSRYFSEMAAADKDRAVANSQLPDPNISMGVANLPTDSFRLNQEPMSQVQIGVSQRFPAGSTLKLQRRQREILSERNHVKKADRTREIALATREAWLDMHYLHRARDITQNTLKEVEGLVQIAASSYAEGKSSGQTVLRSELELDLIHDHLLDIERQQRMVESRVARFIGVRAASRSWAEELPSLSPPPKLDALIEALPRHPKLTELDKSVDAKSVGVKLAQEEYKPSWGVNMNYGNRWGGRQDFASAMVNFSVPLFTGKRQDRRLSAAKHEESAELLHKQARFMDMESQLRATYADWEATSKRVALYAKSVKMRAEETAIASMEAYAHDKSDFPELVRARLADLNIALRLLRLETDQAKSRARLMYFDGGHHDQ